MAGCLCAAHYDTLNDTDDDHAVNNVDNHNCHDDNHNCFHDTNDYRADKLDYDTVGRGKHHKFFIGCGTGYDYNVAVRRR